MNFKPTICWNNVDRLPTLWLIIVMILQTWMYDNGVKRSQMAEMLGVSWQAVDYWLKGLRKPSFKMMQAITAVTDGQVTANDFYNIPPEGE